MSDLASIRAVVYGRVQGVFYRAFTSRQAKELGLTGYVRNLPNGGVEVWAEGERKQLELITRHCREIQEKTFHRAPSKCSLSYFKGVLSRFGNIQALCYF